MNKNQRIVLLATSILIAIMALVPPFHYINQYGGTVNRFYDFIFVNPYEQINLNLLVVQVFLVLSVGSILYLLFDKRNN
jgi:hypothetical protein